MNLHSLTRIPGSRKPRKRVGRGESSGHGKTCGRGNKGQMSRKGHKHKRGFEGGQMKLLRRIPKRGFKNPVRTEYVPVNVGDLAVFADGSVVAAAELRAAGIVKGTLAGIKVLGQGELSRKLTVRAQAFSASAKSKIEAAGGACEIVVA